MYWKLQVYIAKETLLIVIGRNPQPFASTKNGDLHSLQQDIQSRSPSSELGNSSPKDSPGDTSYEDDVQSGERFYLVSSYIISYNYYKVNGTNPV